MGQLSLAYTGSSQHGWRVGEACVQSLGYHRAIVAFPVPADRPTDPCLPAQHDGGGGAARGGNAVKAAGRQLHILPTLGAWCVRRRADEKGRGGGLFSRFFFLADIIDHQPRRRAGCWLIKQAARLNNINVNTKGKKKQKKHKNNSKRIFYYPLPDSDITISPTLGNLGASQGYMMTSLGFSV